MRVIVPLFTARIGVPVLAMMSLPWWRRVPPPRGAPHEFVTTCGGSTGHDASGMIRPPVVREMLNSLAICSRAKIPWYFRTSAFACARLIVVRRPWSRQRLRTLPQLGVLRRELLLLQVEVRGASCGA